jgi:hypothetical protein
MFYINVLLIIVIADVHTALPSISKNLNRFFYVEQFVRKLMMDHHAENTISWNTKKKEPYKIYLS